MFSDGNTNEELSTHLPLINGCLLNYEELLHHALTGACAMNCAAQQPLSSSPRLVPTFPLTAPGVIFLQATDWMLRRAWCHHSELSTRSQRSELANWSMEVGEADFYFTCEYLTVVVTHPI